MDTQLIEQLACYIYDRHKREWGMEFPCKDDLNQWIADFFAESGVPHKHALTNLLSQYGEPFKRSDDWNPYDAYGGNMDDAYYGGVRHGEAQLAADIRDLIGIT